MTQLKPTIKVLLTGAGGQIGYSAVFMMGRGDFFGYDQPIHLVMCDLPVCKNVLTGVMFELQDCAFPLLQKIDVCVDQEQAFHDIDAAILVAGAMALKEGMKRSDLLVANRVIYEKQAQLLDKYAKKNCKVVVVANPANTNCVILAESCKTIPKENFSCLTRLDHNRAQAFIARKCGVSPCQVTKTVVWGNHSSSMVPDASFAMIDTGSKGLLKALDLINDSTWVEKVFVPEVKERAAAVIELRKRSSALSAAYATACHMRDWWNGTKPQDFVSMGVYSDGTAYGIPAGIIFGFPVTIKDGKYTIVKDLPISEETKKSMMISAQELLEEKKMAFE